MKTRNPKTIRRKSGLELEACLSKLKEQPEKETSASWNSGSAAVLPHERLYKDGEETGYQPGRAFAKPHPTKEMAVRVIQISEGVHTVQPNKTTSPAGKWAGDMDTSPSQTDRRHRSAHGNIQRHQPLGNTSKNQGVSTAPPPGEAERQNQRNAKRWGELPGTARRRCGHSKDAGGGF